MWGHISEILQALSAFDFYGIRPHTQTALDLGYTFERVKQMLSSDGFSVHHSLDLPYGFEFKTYKPFIYTALYNLVNNSRRKNGIANAASVLDNDRALNEIWETVRSVNQYLENVKPWAIAKAIQASPEEKEHLEEVYRSPRQIRRGETFFLPSAISWLTPPSQQLLPRSFTRYPSVPAYQTGRWSAS